MSYSTSTRTQFAMVPVAVRADRPEQKADGWQKLVDSHFQDCAVYWEEIYRGNNLTALIYQQRRAAVLKLVEGLGLAEDAKVLEIGCGAGSVAVGLAQRGLTVRAIDTVQEMLDRTRTAAAEAGVAARVQTELGNLNALNFDDDTQDVVIAVGVTPWIRALTPALTEAARVLRPGGHLVISADNRLRLPYLLDPLRFPAFAQARRRVRLLLERKGWRRADRAPRALMYSPREFDAHLADAGLQKRAGRTVGFGPFSFLNCEFLAGDRGIRIHRMLQRLADRKIPLVRATGAHYLVVATKPA